MIKDESFFSSNVEARSIVEHKGHVFIVEDDAGILEIMQRHLSREGYRIYAYTDPQVFLKFVTPVSPAVLLLEMRLSGMTGLEVQARLQNLGITMPVVFISGQSDVAQAVSALESGALQFLVKPVGHEGLIGVVKKGIEHDLAQQADVQRSQIWQKSLKRLAPRELEVLDLLLAGHGNQFICQELGIAYPTAKQYKSNIMIKLGVNSMAELIELSASAKHPARRG